MKNKAKEPTKAISAQPKLIPTHVQPIRLLLKGETITGTDQTLKQIYRIKN